MMILSISSLVTWWRSRFVACQTESSEIVSTDSLGQESVEAMSWKLASMGSLLRNYQKLPVHRLSLVVAVTIYAVKHRTLVLKLVVSNSKEYVFYL